MCNTEYSRKQVILYLIFTFVIAYAIQIGVFLLYKNGNTSAGQLIMTAMMFVPALGVLLSGAKFKGMGWDPRFRKNVGRILIAWFIPLFLTAAGAALYFLVFPQHLDLSGSAFDADTLKQLETVGITYRLYMLITVVSSVTYAPFINTFAALGEEIGWRGFLYPQLKARFGRNKGRMLGGVIWGAWHWPLIWLIGYEYGTDYFGFPVLGMLIFLLFTIALGIIADRLYERSGSIWLPSLFHGAINAAAGLPALVCLTDTGSARLLGPYPNGLIAGLPLLITALFLFILKDSRLTAESSEAPQTMTVQE